MKTRTLNWKVILLAIALTSALASIYGSHKPLPLGVSAEGTPYNASAVEFVYDLTYEKNGAVVHEQRIFEKVFELIDEADRYIVIDMFLFNDDYNRKQTFPELASKLTEKLVARKQANPNIHITFITDEINTFYGAYPSKFLKKLKNNGIQVVVTDLTQIRDSNPTFSGPWRAFLQWFGSSGIGWLPNAFSPNSPEVTLRSYLKLLNFKANHRKVVITDNKALVTSANPHDASGYHSNIAFVVQGDVLGDILASEQAVASFSGVEMPSLSVNAEEAQSAISGQTRQSGSTTNNFMVSLLTEGKIKEHLLEAFGGTAKGDLIQMGMFYLADRDLVTKLAEAAKRGVEVRLVLDPNKDAFGIKKNGVPNRPVAAELMDKSGGAIKIRWYDTHGEQFHTKMTMIRGKHSTVIIGGSANLTKRNLGDLNLETDLKIVAENDSQLVRDVSNYFDRIWRNQEGSYTVNFENYKDQTTGKKMLYRFQEWSGLSSF